MKWSISNMGRNWGKIWNLWRHYLAAITTIAVFVIFIQYLSIDNISELPEKLSGVIGFLSDYTYRLHLILIIVFLITLLIAFYIPFFRFSSKWGARKKMIYWPIVLSVSVLTLYFILSDFTNIIRKFAGWILLFVVLIFLTGYPLQKERINENTITINAKNKVIDRRQQLMGEILLMGIFAILFITALRKNRKNIGRKTIR